jgi:acetoin utilization deacetylase AcuC-like enzyme
MGFCLLNNIAIACQGLLNHPDPARRPTRLAVVDLDLHHGNGTQGIFYRRSEVAFFSTHQWPLYPGSGRLEDRGEAAGLGYTVNLPLPPGAGDQAFEAAMQELILPLLDRMAPQMLLVSFGFDPHWRDPLGSLLLSADGYARLIAALAGWADRHCEGRLALFLEGGYDLEAAEVCSQAVTAALLGQPWQDRLGPAPQDEPENWSNILQSAKRLWNV